MIHPAILYKMLGIPESAGEPTPYTLLGITPRECTPEIIEQALAERKKRLRQNIPSPQFIPMVAVWEQEIERAAAILSDQWKRDSYNTQLATEARKPQAQQARAQERLLVARVREAIQAAVNPDGTLAETKRQDVANRLRELGVPQHNIRSLLAQLPAPAPLAGGPTPQAKEYFPTAVDVAINQGLLTAEDEVKLFDLATKLSIPRNAAVEIINSRLQARSARRGERNAGAAVANFAQRIRILHPDGKAGAAERSRLIALGMSCGLSESQATAAINAALGPLPAQSLFPGAPSSPVPIPTAPVDDEEVIRILLADVPEAGQSVVGIWPFAMPAAAGLFFVIMVLATMTGLCKAPRALLKSLLLPSTQTAQVPPNTPPPTPPTTPTPPESVPPKPTPPQPTPSAPTPPEPITPPAPTPPVPTPPVPPVPAPPVKPTIAATRVRSAYRSTPTVEDLLADTAMTLVGCCDRAARFAGNADNPWSPELEQMVNTSDRIRTLANGVDFSLPASTRPPATTAPAATSVTAALAPADIEHLRHYIASPTNNVRNRAIDALRQADSPQAAAALQQTLGERVGGRRPSDVQAACGILRAMESMQQPLDLLAITRYITQCGMPVVAYEIVQTLERKTRITTSIGAGLLPLRSTPEQQQEAAGWWSTRLRLLSQSARPNPYARAKSSTTPVNPITMPGQIPGAGTPATPQPGMGTPPPAAQAAPPWQPDPLPLQLIAVSENYARQMAEGLGSFRWNAAVPAAGPSSASSGSLRAGPNSADALLLALEASVSELSRLVREHKDAASYSGKADEILRQAQARTLASETVLQKIAVSIDTQGRLLELLAQEVDPQGKHKTERDQVRADWLATQAASATVLYEIRDGCYHNLALWDVVLEGGR